MYEDIEKILSIALFKYQYPIEKVILWGFSLGSGPSVEIAKKYKNIGGLFLEAPLASVYVYLEKDPR